MSKLSMSTEVLQSYMEIKAERSWDTVKTQSNHQIQHNIQTLLANGSILGIMRPSTKNHNQINTPQ